jgi:chromatin remodeling complex protein RSC6
MPGKKKSGFPSTAIDTPAGIRHRCGTAEATAGGLTGSRKQHVQRRSSMAKKKAKKAAKKRKPNAAFMKAMTPDATLAAVIGSNAMPRTEVTKKIWAYIKKNGLQDKKNKRMINADEKLKPLFGGKPQVSMFEMTKLVNKHLR